MQLVRRERLRATLSTARAPSMSIWLCCAPSGFRINVLLQFRLETFNTLNRAQFFGPAAVNGD